MAQNPVDEQADAILLPDVLPVLPLKDAVIFPYIILPLSISRDPSMLAVEDALNGDRVILLAPQRDGSIEEPEEDDLHEIGTAAQIMRMLKLPDGRVRILIQGLARARLRYLSQTEPFLRARVEEVDETGEPHHGLESEALVRSVKEGSRDRRQPGQGHLLRGHGDRRESRSPGPAGGSGGQQPRPAGGTRPSSCWRRHRRSSGCGRWATC